MKKTFFCLFLLSIFLLHSSFTLKERMLKASPGDYIVAESNKMVTLLCVRSVSGKIVLVEEISAPTQNLKKRPASWSDWIQNKAPGHTSWSMIELDLETAQVLECYSFSRSAWLKLNEKENLLSSLLSLSLQPAPKKSRRKIGPPPMEGEPDFRKVWSPPLVFNGKKIENAEFDVYQALWPKDESELSEKDVTLYFDKKGLFPLPYWIQVNTAHITATMRTIDSGQNLPSLYRFLPRRVPEFVGLPRKTKKGLKLTLKSPKYYKEFDLFAIDVTNKKKQIFPVNHNIKDGEDEWKTVEIDFEELGAVLEPQHTYTWLLVPVGHSESYTESSQPFVWTPEEKTD